MSQDLLAFHQITRSFGELRAVDSVSLGVRPGEVFSLLGPSGCGKTTLLRLAAGFDRPDHGRILLLGEDITALPPERRPVNTIFQNYALFPHLTVRDNIAFGPQMAKRHRDEVRREVDRMLDLVDLAAQADQKPAQLSGGQRQRVAIARALINRPQVLLLDEPLAALDLKLRQRLLLELDAIHDTVGITFVYVTHDQSEAMSISDRIAVMNQGRIEQIDTPARIYEAPRTSFVAAFIGDTNFLEGRVVHPGSPSSRVHVPGLGEITIRHEAPQREGAIIHLSLRPEKIDLSRTRPAPAPEENVIAGRVEDVIYFGPTTRYWLRSGERRLCAEIQHRHDRLEEQPPAWEDAVWLRWHARDAYLLADYTSSDEALLTLPDRPSAFRAAPQPRP